MILPQTDVQHITTQVQRYRDTLVQLSHDIHAEPELAFAEYRSARKVTEVLAEAGFEVEPGVAGLDTAFTASVGTSDLVVALCAEYDALPEIGHACGHNIIAAASTGAALALRDLATDLDITVRVVGTPAEEQGGGKQLMLDAGVFDDVAMAMMVHPGPDERCAPTSLACTDITVTYTGRESHAAMAPHLGVNAADAMTVAQAAIGLARQQLEPGQQVHGFTTAGGTASNVIPAHTAAEYLLRAPDAEALQRLYDRMHACFQAGALASGAELALHQPSPPYANLTPDAWLARAYHTAIHTTGRTPAHPAEEPDPPLGSTDMGNVSQVLPSIHPTIHIDSGTAVNHQPEFTDACASPSADQAVCDGARALAHTAALAARDEAQRARLRAGVRARRATGG
ncbi:amidohydrolase [Lipingzhangella sp. LS1_29]|uniref:Peptidase M20 domain-containing protein 2 n=1 Tax=Lipingzhangella rawalii TaxID=2055835 RepID=A0ABU2H489_9ACTN|nr:amidohydrolase [Lipingzhangella rawalii]MDS1270106.1 amidohydrolase [Lipingzhangella rawalii]